jgi:hypothetical protein
MLSSLFPSFSFRLLDGVVWGAIVARRIGGVRWNMMSAVCVLVFSRISALEFPEDHWIVSHNV